MPDTTAGGGNTKTQQWLIYMSFRKMVTVYPMHKDDTQQTCENTQHINNIPITSEKLNFTYMIPSGFGGV